MPRAKRCAPRWPRSTATKVSINRFTTAVWVPDIAPTTARTKRAASTGSTTRVKTGWRTLCSIEPGRETRRMADVCSPLRVPLIAGHKKAAEVTEDVCRPMLRSPSGLWWAGFAFAFSLLLLGVAAVSYQISTGVGTWGLNTTVGWAFDITNFVFWVGIGHAGTLISAILFLFRQKWRTSVNRSAEAMTLFAVMCAGIFP